MEENMGLLGIIESLEAEEHCSECGHAWVFDEPAHYADCRFFLLDERVGEDEEEDITLMGWKTYRPALL